MRNICISVRCPNAFGAHCMLTCKLYTFPSEVTKEHSVLLGFIFLMEFWYLPSITKLKIRMHRMINEERSTFILFNTYLISEYILGSCVVLNKSELNMVACLRPHQRHMLYTFFFNQICSSAQFLSYLLPCLSSIQYILACTINYSRHNKEC